MDDRDWRTANCPNWAKEAAQAEIDAWKLTAALAWPTEARPEPLPFRWGEYDILSGDPDPGLYWFSDAYGVKSVEIKKNDGALTSSWKPWIFRYPPSDNWGSSVKRGPLFQTRRDAALWHLWNECETAARALMKARDRMRGE